MKVFLLAQGFAAFKAARPAVQRWAVDRVGAEFSSLSEALAAVANRLVPDATDGVQLMLDPTTAFLRFGVEVVVGYDDQGGTCSCREVRVRVLLRQVATGRTYHTRWNINFFGVAYEHQRIVREAIAAWRRQEELRKQHLPLLDVFENDKVCHFVTIEDSRTAGNCLAGIEAWLRARGWHERRFARASELICFTSDRTNGWRVMNTLQAAARRIQEAPVAVV